MLSVVVTSSITILLLGGYRLLWRHRYGARRIDGLFVRVQGRIAGPAGEVVLRRSEGEILRSRGLELELVDHRRQAIDLRSPWLILVQRRVRRGQIVTVDGLPTSRPRHEALYRDSAVEPALEALRVAPGAWLELRLLHLPTVFAALLLLGALALPRLVHVRESDGMQLAQEPPPPPRSPEIALACPAGTSKLGGRLEAHCENAAGKLHGPLVAFWSNRRLHRIGQHLEGEMNGVWITRHWGGSLAEEQRFDRGRREGCWRSYYESGQIERVHCFRSDRSHGLHARWNHRGQIVEHGANVDGSKDGLWQTWSDEGVLLSEGRWEQSERGGPWRFWNQDGGRQARGSYHLGKHHGAWIFWHPTGQLAGHGRYRQGVKEGRWTAFYPSGRLAAVASYRRGKRTAIRVWREQELVE